MIHLPYCIVDTLADAYAGMEAGTRVQYNAVLASPSPYDMRPRVYVRLVSPCRPTWMAETHLASWGRNRKPKWMIQ